jgi:hypothetical protein
MPLHATHVQPADQPNDDKDNEDQAEDAAKARQPVASMSVVAAASAEQQDQHNDNKDNAHWFTHLEDAATGDFSINAQIHGPFRESSLFHAISFSVLLGFF